MATAHGLETVMQIEFDSTILGGLPVVILADIEGPDESVGIFSSSATIEEIRFNGRRRQRDRKYIKGSPISRKVWDRISEREFDRLREEALDDQGDY
jgi:hypothetical protein